MKTETRVIAFGKPIIEEAEKNAVLDVLNGPILVHGPRAKAFEADYARFTGAPHAVSVSNCTAALHLCYFYLGLKAGDEVIVPAQTHTATAHAVELCGAKPVFVDAEAKTGNIDLEQVEQKITPNTKAFSLVHFLGMPVNMDRVMQIAKKHSLFVVEDCALAIGTRFKGIHAGLHGDAGCFSFYPVKHMTTAEGGMLITRHPEVAKKIERQKAFGVDRRVEERSIPGVYDVTMLGFNYRMNEIAAAMGIEQLKRMPDFLRIRKQNYEYLSRAVREMPELAQLTSSYGDYESSYYCFSALLNNSLASKRFEIVASLKAQGIGTSVYYPRPVPLMSYYQQKYNHRESEFPVANRISTQSISLPVGPHLDLNDMQIIVQALKKSLSEVSA